MIEFKDLVVGQLLEVTDARPDWHRGLSVQGVSYVVSQLISPSTRSSTPEAVDVPLTCWNHPFNHPEGASFTVHFTPNDDPWFTVLTVLPLLTPGQEYVVPADCYNGAIFFTAGERYVFHHLEGNTPPWQLRPIIRGQERNGFMVANEYLPSFARVFGLGAGALLPVPTGVIPWRARDPIDQPSSPPPAPIASTPPVPDLCGLVAGQLYTVVRDGGGEVNGIMRSYIVGERWRFLSSGSGRWKTTMVVFADGTLQSTFYGDSDLTAEHLPRLAHIFGLDVQAPVQAPTTAPVPVNVPDLHGFVVGETYTVAALPVQDRGGDGEIHKFFDAPERWMFLRDYSGDATDGEGPWRLALLTNEGVECGYDERQITREKLARLARIFGLTAPAPHDLLVPGQTYTVANPKEFLFTPFLLGEKWKFSLQDGGDPENGPWKVNHLVDSGEESSCSVRNIHDHELSLLAEIFGLDPAASPGTIPAVVKPVVILHVLHSRRGARPRRFTRRPEYHTNQYEVDPAQDPSALPY